MAAPLASKRPGARAKRSPLLGCVLFSVALVTVILVAAAGALALRAVMDGRLQIPGVSARP
jgi:hypothetical protein